MMYKRLLNIIAYVIVVSILFSIVVSAQELQNNTMIDNKKTDTACFRLISLNVIEKAMLEKADKEITRGEFVHIVLKLLNYDAAIGAANKNNSFSDVLFDYQYVQDISLATDMNLINGYSDGTFKPNDYIKYEEAIKVLVDSLGYQSQAQDIGGYPMGYLSMAAQINLLTGTVAKTGESLLFSDVFVIVNQALKVELLLKKFYKSQDYLVKNGQTLYDIKMNSLKLVHGNGMLNKNNKTSISSTNDRSFKKDEVMIGNEYFYVGDTNANEFLAYEVEYYAKESLDNDIYTLVNIRVDNKSSNIILKAEQINSATLTEIKYDDDNKQSIQLESKFNLIYNSKLTDTRSVEMLMIKNGTLEAIDADGNGIYETVFINEYKILTVNSINNDREIIYFKDGQLNSSKIIELTSNKDYDIKIYDDSKKEISLLDIKADDIIEAYSSKDGKIVRMYIVKKTIQGKIAEMGNDNNRPYVLIDGKKYKVNSDDINLMDKIELNLTGVFYVDEDGVIVKYLEDLTQADVITKYALVESIGIASGLEKKVSIRLIEGGIYKDIQEDADEDGMIDARYMQIANTGVKIYECAKDVYLENTKIKSSSLPDKLVINVNEPKKNSVIEYKLNSENKISNINRASANGILALRTLNTPSKLFGGSVGGAFIMDSSTKIIAVPAYISSGYEEGLYLSTNKLQDKTQFEVLSFDVDPITKKAKVVVIATTESSGVSGINNKTKVSIINKLSSVMNEDEQVYKIFGFTGNTEFSKYTTATAKVKDIVDGLKPSDLVYYSLDYKDRINDISVLKGFSQLEENFNREGDKTEIFGEANYVTKNYVAETATDLQDLVILNVSNSKASTDLKTITFSSIIKPPIYVYNQRENKVYAGTVDDIQTTAYVGAENASKVYAFIKDGVVKVMLIINH